MKTISLIISVLFIIFFVSCTIENNTNEVKDIINLEKKLYSDTVNFIIDNKVADILIEKYETFAENYKTDSLAPESLYKEAELLKARNKIDDAIKIYDKIINTYPNNQKAPLCLFLKAFIYDVQIQDMLNAKKYYQEFIDKYPNHELADDAKLSIENLGKSPEELIREFEAKQDSI